VSTGPRLTVVLADDQATMRAWLREDLEREGIDVVAEAADGVEAVERAIETHPTVCLFDLNMPRASGLEAAAKTARALHGTSVVLISVEVTPEAVVDAVRAGAVGFLTKDIAPTRLAAALRAVAAGECAFPRRELRRALAAFAVTTA
jgi:DNA-binding NarL/FixJ family response regulator